ncbi:MAG: hypothetical protein RL076_1072 [Chloroflexota bacterium]
MHTYRSIAWMSIAIICMCAFITTSLNRLDTVAAIPRTVALPTAGIVAPTFRGQAITWGTPSGNLHRLPASTQSGVKQLVVSDHHALAITATNSVVGWGINLNGELTIPRTLSNIVQVTTGITHSAALNATGNATIWGHANVLKQGRNFSNIVQIASGDAHVVLLRNGGGVIVAGGTTAQRTVPSDFNCGGVILCNAARAAVAVAAGSDSSVVLSANGDVTQWGSTRTVPTLARVNMVRIFAHGNIYAGISQDGTLILWGAVDTLDIGAVSGATRLDEGGAKYIVIPTMTGIIGVESAKWGVGLIRRSGAVVAIPYYAQQVPVLPNSRVVSLGMYRTHTTGIALSYATTVLAPTTTRGLQLDTLAGERTTQAGNVVTWGDESSVATIPSLARDGNVIQVVAGRYHAVALRNDSVVVAWGDTMYGQSTVPNELDDIRSNADPLRVVAVAAGGNHSVALRANGTVTTWGDNTYAQLQIPAGIKPVVQISAGARHTIALQQDGTLVGWGDNSLGQINVPKVGGVTKIATGYFHNLALLRNGEIYTWGSNSFGQLTLPTLRDVVDVAASNANSMFLHRDGTITVIGLNSDEQLHVPAGNYQHIDAGFNHLLAIDTTGKPVAWGLDTNNQTQIPSSITQAFMLAGGSDFSLALVPNPATFGAPTPQPTREQRAMRITRLAAGSESAVATVDGTVVVWGNDAFNQYAAPVLSNIVAVASGQRFHVALDDTGNVSAWGDGISAAPLGLPPIRALAAGDAHVIALAHAGTVHGWGTNSAGQLTIPGGLNSVVAVAAGAAHSLALKSDGTVVGWGDNTDGQITIPGDITTATAIAAAGNYSMALLNDGSIRTWGSNAHGQQTIPPTAINCVAIAAGTTHALALTRDGNVIAWGDAAYGATTVPTTIRRVSAVVAGRNTSFAMSDDGTVVAWGRNDYRQLDMPRQLSGIADIAVSPFQGTTHSWGTLTGNLSQNQTNIQQIAIGTDTMALLSQSGVITFPTGSGSVNTALTSAITSTGNIAQIAMGDFGVALTRNRRVLTWGPGAPAVPDHMRSTAAEIAAYADHLMIVNSAGEAWSNKFAIPTTRPVVHVAANQTHGVLLYDDGNVTVVGTDDESGITQIPSTVTNIRDIAIGEHHVMALTSSGAVLAWGADGDNQDFGQADVPYSARTNVYAIAAGDTFSLALRTDGTVIAWGNLPSGTSSALSTHNAAQDVVALVAKHHTIALLSDSSTPRATIVPSATRAASPTATSAAIAGEVTLNQIGWFTASETSAANSWNTNTGTVSCTPRSTCPLVTDGVRGSAVWFDDRVGDELVSSQPLVLANKSFTVSFWMRRDRINQADIALSYGQPSLRKQLTIGIDATNRVFCNFFGDDVRSSMWYTDTAWHHYACTFNATTLTRRIYRDGVIIAQDRSVAPLQASATPFSIGRRNDSAEGLRGSIDGLAIYERELTNELTTFQTLNASNPLVSTDFEYQQLQSRSANQSTLTCTTLAQCATIQRANHNMHALEMNGESRLRFSETLPGSRGFGVIAWVYARPSTSTMVVVGHGTADTNSVEIGYTSDQRIYCRIADQSVQTSPGMARAWQHVACSYDTTARSFTLYVNSVAVATRTSVTYSASSHTVVGQSILDTKGFNGYVDDLFFYNAPLTPALITQLYNATSPEYRVATLTTVAGSRTATPTYSRTTTASRTSTNAATKTRLPATSTATMPIIPTMTFTASPTRSATMSRTPSGTRNATLTSVRPATATVSPTRTISPTSTPLMITRTMMVILSPIHGAQTMTAAVFTATAAANQAKTQTVIAIPTETRAAALTATSDALTPTMSAYPLPITNTATRSRTRTSSITVSRTRSRTPSITRTPTKSTTHTKTRTNTRTNTPTNTYSPTPTITPSPTDTPVPTNTPIPTATTAPADTPTP